MMNKRGQIGSTFTWFAAIFIIIFILMLFLVITGKIAGTKEVSSKVPFSSQQGFDRINLVVSSDSLRIQRNLSFMLNAPGNDLTLKEAIIKWDLDKTEDNKRSVKNTIGNLLNNNPCYVFSADGENVYQTSEYPKEQNILRDASIGFGETKLAFETASGVKEINVGLYLKRTC